LHAMQALSQL